MGDEPAKTIPGVSSSGSGPHRVPGADRGGAPSSPPGPSTGAAQSFREIADALPYPLLLVTGAGRVLGANGRACGLLGRSPGELEGGLLLDAVEGPRVDLLEQLRAFGQSTTPVPGLLRLCDGAHPRRCHGARLAGTPAGEPQIAIALDTTSNRVLEDLADRVAETEKARRAAERASRVKDQFLATVSHELRSPLNAILGWTQILSDLVGGEQEDEREAVDTILRNARAQARLIDDLLDVSRIIAGKIRLDLHEIDPVAVVRSALESVQQSADDKGVSIALAADEEPGTLHADADRVRQIVWNLLSNAVKFTPPGGRVEVSVLRAGSSLHLTVSDTGEGVEPEILPYLFNRFLQEDASSTRRHGGLGLGLAIVRNLAEAHGGHVEASSEGKGRGATFRVILPVLPPLPSVAAPAAEKVPVGTRTGASQREIDLRGVSILVVEDERDSRRLLVRELEAVRADVAEAASVDEALRLLQNWSPDVLISDVEMPVRDGHELLRTLRGLPPEVQARTVPAIALTGYARGEDRVRALEAGFQIHLAKPVERRELLAAVASLADIYNEGPAGPT